VLDNLVDDEDGEIVEEINEKGINIIIFSRKIYICIYFK
jgi:hypothetical protein